jgi:hypothetical protein
LHWSVWVGAAFTVGVSLFWVIPNFKSPPVSEQTSNPIKPLNQLPAFDEGLATQATRNDLDDLNQQIVYFLNEESQRIRVQFAMGFLAIASETLASGEGNCKTQIECLQSLSRQRISNLENIIDQIQFEAGILPPDKNTALQPLRSQLIATEEIEAWRLALVLAKPAELRTPQEKWELETRYTILKSRVPVESLTPRPAMLVQLLKGVEKQKIVLRAGSPEEQARFERRQKLCKEDQKKCNQTN